MQVATASDAARLLAPLFAAARGEKLAVAHLDAGRALLAVEEPAAGGAGHVDLPIRAIIVRALDLGAEGLILAHNHPSGDPSPSRADIAATRRFAATADALGIRLFDHLIFAGGDCRSFRALGLL